jgi:hypothetical protein
MLLVILGDGSFQEKISYIDGTLYKGDTQWIWHWILAPALSAIAFVVLSPFVQRWVLVFLRERNKETQVQLLKIAEDTPLSNEAATRLRRLFLDEQQARKNEAKIAAGRIDELTAQIDLLSKELGKAKVENKSSSVDDILNRQIPELLEKKSDLDADTDVSNRIANGTGPLFLEEGDFSVLPEGLAAKIVQRPLSSKQANALYQLRNGDVLNTSELANRLGSEEQFEAQVSIDKLLNIGFVESRRTGYGITPIGREALSAILSRGFTPDKAYYL